VDSAQLLSALRHISEAGINIRSMTIVRNGYVVLEAANQPFTADIAYQTYSVTKSVMGALIGIAIHEGYIKDVKQTVLSFFPELTIAKRDKDKEAITIEDLLSMQAGLDCGDDKLNFAMEASKDWIQFALDLPMASPAGQQLVYCTAGPHILSAILTKATGMSTQAYAQSRLFTPLGIAAGKISWETDPQGITIGGYGISMEPRDMAKLGLLYLYGGKWDGKQVVPEEWVSTSTKTHAIGDNRKDYGYLFWVYPSHFAAEGLGEQKIMVVKDRNMVVVMTSAIDWHKGPALEKLLDDYLVPAANSTGPLPANPAAFTSLQGRIKYLANPAQPVQPLSEAARYISGKTYAMQDNNPAGWKSITLTFEEGSPEAKASVAAVSGANTLTQTVAIGMDNVYRVERSPDGGFTARRGYWLDDHTLVVRQLQSSPDLQETEIRAEFNGDRLSMHAEEVVFGTYAYDLQGIVSPPDLTASPTSPTSREPTILLPEAGAQVMVPLHIMARMGRPGDQVTAELQWHDGTKLANHFTLLTGEDGQGLLIGNLDWVNMLQPPEPRTQAASLQIRDSPGKVLVERDVKVVGSSDADTRQVKLFWTVSGNDEIVQPQIRQVVGPAPGGANVAQGVATRALEELLWGPPAISQVGFGTALPTPEQVLGYPGRPPDWGPRVTLLGLTIETGVATANFSKEMRAYGGGSLRVKLIRDQVTQTLMQFPGVDEVRIAIEGETEAVLEP
jgi:CubicO group peptidase (beta-lactamase class C family)